MTRLQNMKINKVDVHVITKNRNQNISLKIMKLWKTIYLILPIDWNPAVDVRGTI